MKRTLTALLLLGVLTSPAFAASEDLCSKIGDMAQVIMEGRQAGIPPSVIRNATRGNPLSTQMATEAFKVGRWHSEEFQRREVQDFRAVWEVRCYKNLGDPA